VLYIIHDRTKVKCVHTVHIKYRNSAYFYFNIMFIAFCVSVFIYLWVFRLHKKLILFKILLKN